MHYQNAEGPFTYERSKHIDCLLPGEQSDMSPAKCLASAFLMTEVRTRPWRRSAVPEPPESQEREHTPRLARARSSQRRPSTSTQS
jgi:hypothetical protein